jgi:type VI protein secretion system component VasF
MKARAFPGGPRSRPGTRAPRLERLEAVRDRDERLVVLRLRRRRTRRVRRQVLGFLAATLVAAGVGAYLGFATRTTHEELSEAQQRAHRRDLDVSREVNRALLELWKMEDVEGRRAPIR